MRKILKWFIRLFLWVFSGFGLLNKVLVFVGGTDYLHPFAPYSFGGFNRRDFLLLLKRQKNKEVIGHQMVDLYKYESLRENVSRQKFLEVNERERFVYNYFLSPWKKNRYQ